MNARLIRHALLAAFLFAPRIALAESWNPAELAEAEKLRSDEAARALAYRERVARGEVRAAAAPMPREAPQTPGDRAPGDALRGAADIVDLLERWLGDDEAEAEPPREPTRDELRQEQRERRQRGADAWWEEEERRTQGTQ